MCLETTKPCWSTWRPLSIVWPIKLHHACISYLGFASLSLSNFKVSSACLTNILVPFMIGFVKLWYSDKRRLLRLLRIPKSPLFLCLKVPFISTLCLQLVMFVMVLPSSVVFLKCCYNWIDIICQGEICSYNFSRNIFPKDCNCIHYLAF